MSQGDKQLRKKLAAAFSSTEVRGRDTVVNDDAAWATAVDSIWVEQKDVFETVSRKTVSDACYSLVKQLAEANRDVQVENIRELFSRLKEPDVQEFTVFRTMMGVYTESDTPLRFGPFTVFHPARHRNGGRFPEQFAKKSPENRTEIGTVEYVVSVQKKAREYIRSKELADESFATFENVLRYMSSVKKGGHTWFSPGIFDQHRARNLSVVVRSSSGEQRIEESRGPRATVNLDESRYTESANGNEWIWNTLVTDTPNKLQSRVITAVEWIGQGMHELQDEKRFVQFMFALESLFNRNEKTFISPSVGSLITECAAFVIGRNVDERLQIKKLVNGFYSDRSAIVHGGSTSITPDDVRLMFRIVTMLVQTLTTDERFTVMTSVDAFHEWVQHQKFSLPSDENA